MIMSREKRHSTVVFTLLNKDKTVKQPFSSDIYLLIFFAYSVGVSPVAFLKAMLK